MIPINAGHVQQTIRPGSGGTVLSIGNSTVTLQANNLGAVYAKPTSPQKIYIKSGQVSKEAIVYSDKFSQVKIYTQSSFQIA